MQHKLSLLALATSLAFGAIINSADAGTTRDHIYVGHWALAGDDCTDPIVFGPGSLNDSVDLACQFAKVEQDGNTFSTLARCGQDNVRLRFSVDGDALTFLEGIDFGRGLPSLWHRCPDLGN